MEDSRFEGGSREQVYLVEAADKHIYLSQIKPGERQLARDRRRQVDQLVMHLTGGRSRDKEGDVTA